MAVPRNRHSNARKNTKKAHHARKARQFASCPNCNAMKLPHRACAACGYYSGRQVMEVASD